jgi:transcription termination/antitermination protein NusG
MPNPGWHALFVFTGGEDKVKERLQYRFKDQFRIMVPKRKLRERKNGSWYYRTRVLFPGYVILKGNIDAETYYDMKSIPGIIRHLKTGNELASITEGEMNTLSKLVCNEDEIGISSLLIENGNIRIIEGPLYSMEGIIKDINTRKGRAKVVLSFLGEERVVELGVSLLEPA